MAAAESFSKWLGEQLEARHLSVRRFAKAIADQMDEPNTEVSRRAVNRYLHSGARPTKTYQRAIAAVLGVDSSALPLGGRPDAGDPFRGRAR